jgi:hypothetical protein
VEVKSKGRPQTWHPAAGPSDLEWRLLRRLRINAARPKPFNRKEGARRREGASVVPRSDARFDAFSTQIPPKTRLAGRLQRPLPRIKSAQGLPIGRIAIVCNPKQPGTPGMRYAQEGLMVE